MPFCSSCGSSVAGGISFCSSCGQNLSGAPSTQVAKTVAAPASEKEFYKSTDVLVTNSRFVVGAQTFAMGGVTSVSSYTQPPSHVGPIVVIIVGLMITM